MTGAFCAYVKHAACVQPSDAAVFRGYGIFVPHSELTLPDRGFIVNNTLSLSVDVCVTRHVEWSAYVSPRLCSQHLQNALLHAWSEVPL